MSDKSFEKNPELTVSSTDDKTLRLLYSLKDENSFAREGRMLKLLVAEAAPSTYVARRAFDPPELVDVACDGDIPRAVTWRGHRIAITRALGPERLSGDWWDDGYRRDYWRCESASGEVVVFLDRADDAWRMQAWAD